MNDDIVALVPLLRAGGIPVPDLVRTDAGQSHAQLESGVWRVLTQLPGRTLHAATALSQVRNAGAAMGDFHTALLESRHEFAFSRPGAHNTVAHMEKLRAALARHEPHRLYPAVEAIAEGIFGRWSDFGSIPNLPLRIGHGDPKISNFLFAPDHTISGVIDLDTMAWTSVDIEIGDALRSWCNRGTEDQARADFDIRTADAALEGYLSRAPWLTDEECESLPASAERICLELAARFAADALEETYFGWDPEIATGRGEHNLLRARGQLSLAVSARNARSDLEASCHRHRRR